MGSLLLDVRNFGGENFFTPFDAVDAQFDGVSSVYTDVTGNANSALADSLTTRGLVTGFTIVPEPKIATALLFGGGLLFASAWKRRVAQHKAAGSNAG